jgi:hypothetical protein
MAPVQPEGDASSATGRAGTPKPRVAQPESWTPGPCVARVELLRRVRQSDHQALFRRWSDYLGSRLDRQLLFHGRSDRLGSRSDCSPLF